MLTLYASVSSFVKQKLPRRVIMRLTRVNIREVFRTVPVISVC